MSLGNPHGVFDLHESNRCVGSFIKKDDVKKILGVTDKDLSNLSFVEKNGIEVIDERKIHVAWRKNEIPNAPKVGVSSLDEFILICIIKNVFPDCEIERQIRVKRFKMDLKLTYKGKSIFVEFDGPSHFAISRFGPPRHEPFRKKKIVEDATGIEVVNWAYWIQRCEANVRALFDDTVNGFGALWSTNVHFGDFYFDNSAEIIDTINKRFNVERNGGYGYFYGTESFDDRLISEHPIIKKIKNGSENIKRILPRGYDDINKWIPSCLV